MNASPRSVRKAKMAAETDKDTLLAGRSRYARGPPGVALWSTYASTSRWMSRARYYDM